MKKLIKLDGMIIIVCNYWSKDFKWSKFKGYGTYRRHINNIHPNEAAKIFCYCEAHTLLSGPNDGPAPTIPYIVTLDSDHSNQTRLQHYLNPTNQGFCCHKGHASYQLKELVEFVPELANFEEYLCSKFEEGLSLEIKKKRLIIGTQSYKKII